MIESVIGKRRPLSGSSVVCPAILLAAVLLSPPMLHAVGAPAPLDLQAEWKSQFADLAAQLKQRTSTHWQRAAGETFRPEATLGASDRDPLDVVLRRTEALLADLRRTAPNGDWSGAADRLAALKADSRTADPADAAARYGLYEKACKLRREIAFANPLLNFDKVVFIKRHFPGGPFHMCDQFYGCNARKGGGLYVLSDPFGAKPKLTDLLADATVENGRLKGQKLAGGAFLSPELSYDGKTILFAYTQAKATETYQWGPEISWHVFKVGAGGRGLKQLTDGPADDFDPCFLPNGRVVFITERRGGYLRCGRHCPVYTMFTMDADGGDIRCMSYHETHEWQPSVNHDGMIVYTRWDYVDRDTNVAHHIWTCYPDGRDPRSFHGNYPRDRKGRPWMEMDLRAIPDSHRYVATTGAHHGNAFGALVVIDQSLEDDGAMSQLKRLTPEAPFPEAETKPKTGMRYGTAWPLAENYYLCAHDAAGKNHGIYLLDAFGNKELLYRDESIPSISPIPLRARPRPPIVSDALFAAANPAEKPARAPMGTFALANVYDGDFSWPKDSPIKSLRIIQLLPKTTAPPNRPRIGVANQTNARAVLGSVPVEPDGSAHFEVPADKPVYFQALDADGLAVQSMRSLTYIQPGRVVSCQGCHEPKRRSPNVQRQVPLAMRRPASKIAPDVGGSNPFNYVRLVQGVLDRHCVQCHRERKALDLSGSIVKGDWTRSYVSLASKYGSYYHVGNGSINQGVHGGVRSIPGQFGARAAKLTEYLDKKHYGVKLSPADRHRLTLWLDCNSEFFGAYENAPAQARGEIVKPALE